MLFNLASIVIARVRGRDRPERERGVAASRVVRWSILLGGEIGELGFGKNGAVGKREEQGVSSRMTLVLS